MLNNNKYNNIPKERRILSSNPSNKFLVKKNNFSPRIKELNRNKSYDISNKQKKLKLVMEN